MITLLSRDNHLFQLARQAHRLPHIGIVVLVNVLMLGLSLAAQIPLVLTLRALQTPPTALDIIQMLWVAALYILFLSAWLRWYEKRSLSTTGLEIRQDSLKQYFRGAALAVLAHSGVVAILALLGYLRLEAVNSSLGVILGVLVIYIAWAAQGLSEEIIYRGWILPTIGARYSPPIGLISSSILYAVVHGLNPGSGLLPFVNIFLLGVFACLYVLAEESLWGRAGWHAAWNWAQGNLFGLQVSGFTLGGTLLHLELTRKDLISGGDFGPEGGVIVTVLALVGISVLLAAKRNKMRSAQEVTVVTSS